jgi:cardiolipin synthase
MAARKSKRKFSSAYTENKIKLVRGGRDYFTTLLHMIGKAKSTIHFQTYIFEDDETGRSVADALIAAAQRNVIVYLLLDGYASQSLPAPFIKKLQEAGIHFRFFEPLVKSRHFYFGRRLHNKIVVIDTACTLVGGVNITNRYNDMPGQPAWLDFALYTEGPVSKEVAAICWKNWKGFTRQSEQNPSENDHPVFDFNKDETSLVRVRVNDWVRNKLQISKTYQEMFKKSNSYIIILSSYALPGIIFRKSLEKAVKRGVVVKMIITGESDVMLVKNAERYWYDWLMRNNIAIYEYTKNVLHGKLSICDGEMMTIGSYNVNDLSAYASVELNMDVKDTAFITKAEKMMQKIMDEDCVLISRENLAITSNLFKRFVQWLSYTLIRLAFNVSTFYYRQQRN